MIFSHFEALTWNKYDKWAEEKDYQDYLCLSTVCLFVKLVPLQSKVRIKIKDLPGDEGWNFLDVSMGSL